MTLINMENEVKHNDCGKPAKFQFKEPFVLCSILSLMLICGVNSTVASAIAEKNTYGGLYETMIVNWHYSPIMALGILLTSILSETKGRKPTFISLSAASIILSGSLHAFSNEETCVKVAFVLEKIIRGGIFATTFLAIPEFCSPKHRFAYLIANKAAFRLGCDLPLLCNMQVENIVAMRVALGFQLVIETFCLGVAFAGPESPYWLARRDRIGESKRALLWLRGEGSEAELSSILNQHQHRNVRVFWFSLVAGMSAISVSAITSQIITLSVVSFNPMLELKESYLARLAVVLVILPIIASISYKVNHKSIYLVTSVIPLVFVYVLAFWSYFEIDGEYTEITTFFRKSINILISFGPLLFGIVSFAEVIPSKYNTYVSCMCFMFFCLMILLTNQLFFFFWLPIYVLFILGTTVSLICVFIFYFSSPETKDKMLFDIQKMYTPRQRY